MFFVLFIVHLLSIVQAFDSHDRPLPYDVLNQQAATFGSQVSPRATCLHRYENIPTEKENCERTHQTVCHSVFQNEVLCKIYALSSFCKCVCPKPQRISISSEKHSCSPMSRCMKKNEEEYYPGITNGCGDIAHLQVGREYRSLETCTYGGDKVDSLINDDIRKEELNAYDSGKEDTDTSPICNSPASASQEMQNSSIVTNVSKIYLRQEIDGGPFNYASDTKGAKVLASNREAKGAMSILNKDKDKYYWTPCNAESKYVDIELSEETLVVEIVIANYEFFSSNIKDFQLWGSSTYPIEEWDLLGNFEAENCRISQKFTLGEPKWVRYLRFKVLNHYGSDFYCTLSALELHGIDAIEWLLIEWFTETHSHGTQKTHNDGGDVDQKSRLDYLNEQNLQKVDSQCREKAEEKKRQPEHHRIQRPTLDAVMKLMMEKIRFLEQTQPHFLQLKELDDGYIDVLTLYVNQLNSVKAKLEETTAEISAQSKEIVLMEQIWYQEKHELETEFSNQMRMWITEFDTIRSELKTAVNQQLVAMIVTTLSVLVVVCIHVLVFCRTLLLRQQKHNQKWLLSIDQILWIVPLSSSILVAFVLVP